jgi:hypothetical protein
MGLTQASGAISTPGAALETISATLDAVQNLNGSWYGFTLTKEASTADIQAAAAWAQTQVKIFGYTVSDVNSLNAASTTDLGYLMKAAGYKRVCGQFDPVNPYAVLSLMGRAFTVDFTQPDSTITLMFKQEPGVSVIKISDTQRLALEGKNLNYYTTFGDSAMLARGVMADGSPFDQVQGLDWLQNNLQTVVFAYLLSKPKVAQTDKGVAQILQQISVAMQQAVDNGLLAPGFWTGAQVGQVKNGQFLASGYYAYAAPVASQTEVQNNARQAPPITVLAIGAGAIQGVSIQLDFQQ